MGFIKRTVNINGTQKVLLADPETSLAKVLREQLGLTGTKIGCGHGQCGACSVLLDGKVIRSCVYKMKRLKDGAVITTIEGIGSPENLHPLQLAWIKHGGAQCGFCAPGFIVSAKGLLDQNQNPTREEVRNWFQKHRNACRCTGYIPLVDAVMDAAKVLRGEMSPKELLFEMPADGRIWGSSYPRPSSVAKVTGTCDYGADLGLKLPDNTLHLKLVQAKISHAKILSIDTSEAEKMPGVYKVLTHKDVKGKNRIYGIPLPANKGDGWDRPILCDEKVFQYGDAIAIVCADTEENAKNAVAKVKVELEPLPAYMSAPDAMAKDAIEIHPGTSNVFFTQKIAKGEETGPIMEKADVTIEGNYYIGRQPHLPIEPDVGFAYFDEEGRLTIHSKSVGIYLHRDMIAPGLGIEPDKLRLVQNPAGGTFGYKLTPTIEGFLGVAAMATGRPVFLRYDFHQQLTYTGKRSPFFINLKYAATKEGKIIAMESDWTIDHGPYAEYGDLLTLRAAQFLGAGYGIPNIRGEGRAVYTNHAWGSPMRGYGSPQAEFASEVLMDELAEKLGMDPLEIRYKNVYRPGDTTPTGCTPDVYSLPTMLDIIRPLYKEAKKRARARSTDNKKYGVGISIGVYGCGDDGKDTAEIYVELTKTGVKLFTSWEDHGQGAEMGVLGTAHEALRPLGIKPEQIELVMNDTALTPNSGAAIGSRSQVIIGQAIQAGCELLIEAMRKPDGSFRTYEEMVAEGIPLRYLGKHTAISCTACDENAQGNPFPTYQYGVFMPEVVVDVNTGKVFVEKITCVVDVGVVGNKLLVDGQIYGGLVQGIGLALSEGFEDLDKHKSMISCGFPYIKDAPHSIEIIYVETHRPLGAFGASGCGELGITSPHAAIINAIYDACGVRIRELPALPEKVLAGIKSKER